MKTRTFVAKNRNTTIHLTRVSNVVNGYTDQKSEFRREFTHVFNTVAEAKKFMASPTA